MTREHRMHQTQVLKSESIPDECFLYRDVQDLNISLMEISGVSSGSKWRTRNHREPRNDDGGYAGQDGQRCNGQFHKQGTIVHRWQ
jgi:hypothetical protein